LFDDFDDESPVVFSPKKKPATQLGGIFGEPEANPWGF